jgi:hypothetical protein
VDGYIDGSAKDDRASWARYFGINSTLNNQRMIVGPKDSNFAELNATMRILEVMPGRIHDKDDSQQNNRVQKMNSKCSF